VTGEPDWPAATADERAGLPVTVRPGRILTLDEVRQWVAAMEAAGADGESAVWGLTGQAGGNIRGAGAGFPGGLAPQLALGGYPRGGYGPVDIPGLRERTPIEDEPPEGTAGG
jgi:hypothetical protein